MNEPLLKVITDKPPTLDEARAIIGGWVEMIWVHQGQLLVDEEGTLKRLPINYRATRLAGQRIVGNAIYLRGPAMWQPEEDEDEA